MRFTSREALRAKWRSWGPAGLVVAAIAVFLLENWKVDAQIDDAYIFYRYARHLVAGHGFVFNIGERVEGVTSLLWTLLVTAGVAAGAEPVLVGRALGLLSGTALLAITYRYATFGLAGGERLVGALSTWMLLATVSFSAWATSGMETPLFALAVTAALVAEGRGRFGLAVLGAAVATLTRPEGVILAGTLFGVALWRARHLSRRTAVLLFGYVLFLAVLTAVRLLYFGSPLPNTFYAKVGGASWSWSAYYLGAFVMQTALPMIAPAAYALRDPYLFPGVCYFLCTVLSVVAIGGDAFPYGRFFLPTLPVLCALVVRGAIVAHRHDTGRARFAKLGVGVCFVWFVFGVMVGVLALLASALVSSANPKGSWRRPVRALALALFLAGSAGVQIHEAQQTEVETHETLTYEQLVRWAISSTRWAELRKARTLWAYIVDSTRLQAETLNRLPPEDKLIASTGIGVLGYYCDARIFDILGLVDSTIARTDARMPMHGQWEIPGHQRGNPKYVVARKPDFILVPNPGSAFFRLPAVLQLWKNPTFKRRYRWDPRIEGYRRIKARPRPEQQTDVQPEFQR